MTDAITAGQSASPRATFNWIISPKADLTWFIGSVCAAYMIYFMYAGLGWNMVLVGVVWVIMLDLPHFFGTINRTYLDKQERRTRKPLLIGSLGIFLLGPALLAISFILYQLEVEEYKWPWLLLRIFVSLWAYWHVTRQHFGFLRLYRRKNNETNAFDEKLDSWVLYGCLLVPFFAFLAHHPKSRIRVGLEREITPAVDGSLVGGWEHWVNTMAIAIVALLLGVYLWRQWSKWRQHDPINVPKLLYLAAVIPLHVFLCFSPSMTHTGLLTFTIIVTIFHDIQYLAIVWFYNKNRFQRSADPVKQYGWSARLSQNFMVFWVAGILLVSVPIQSLSCYVGKGKICSGPTELADPTFLGPSAAVIFFIMVTAGLQMHHYVLDQYIWRPSRNKDVRRDLKLNDNKN